MTEVFYIVVFSLALLIDVRTLGMTIMARRAMITIAIRSSKRLNPFGFLNNGASFPNLFFISQY